MITKKRLTQEQVDNEHKLYDEWLNSFKTDGVEKTAFSIWLACAKQHQNPANEEIAKALGILIESTKNNISYAGNHLDYYLVEKNQEALSKVEKIIEKLD